MGKLPGSEQTKPGFHLRDVQTNPPIWKLELLVLDWSLLQREGAEDTVGKWTKYSIFSSRSVSLCKFIKMQT